MSAAPEKSPYGMGRAARLNLSLQILNEMAEGRRPLDAIVAGHFKHLKDTLERRDRRDLEQRLNTILMTYRKLLWWLNKIKLPVNMRSLILAHMVLNEKCDMAQLQKLCNGAHQRLDQLSKEEFSALKSLQGQALVQDAMAEAVRLECPDWAQSGFKKAFGPDYEDELRALSDKPSYDLRTNRLKATRDDVRESLAKQGFKTDNSPLSPLGLTQSNPAGPVLAETQAFRDGLVEVQDEGSQLVGLMVDAHPGMQVIDFCAGAGGKTLCIAGQMENKGHLVASDVHSKRLNRAKMRLKRAGVINTERRLLENTFDKWIKKNKGKYDRVLIDAPCSGTGTWRRNPDSKWAKDETDLTELMALQKDILSSASRLTKVGGRLIYATCSLLPEENEEQVEAFVAQNPEFQVLNAKSVWSETVGTDYPGAREKFLRLSPYKNGCDGFFVAVLERK